MLAGPGVRLPDGSDRGAVVFGIVGLADAASDKECLVRASAVAAIARRGDPELLSAIVPLLDDEQDTVRFNAAAAVVMLSASRGGPARW
jgi:HEAT repeat protein